MKLLRYGAPGREKPGLADKDGNIRDLSKVITQIDDAMLSPRNLARLARVKPETLPIVRGSPRLGVPYAGISKFVAIGLNYRDHAEEAGLAIPAEPIVFMKASTCLCGPNDDTVTPKASQKLDYDYHHYVITDRSLRIRAGVWHVHEMTMTFANVQNISIRQGPLQRLLGIADLVVQTAGGGSSARGPRERHGQARIAAHDGQGLGLHAREAREVARREHRVVDLRDHLREVADVAILVGEAGLFATSGAVA